MAGLPIVDELYFAHPSIGFGGWIAVHISRTGVQFMNFVAGEVEIVDTPIKSSGYLPSCGVRPWVRAERMTK